MVSFLFESLRHTALVFVLLWAFNQVLQKG
jgi:hypothetical protein